MLILFCFGAGVRSRKTWGFSKNAPDWWPSDQLSKFAPPNCCDPTNPRKKMHSKKDYIHILMGYGKVR